MGLQQEREDVNKPSTISIQVLHQANCKLSMPIGKDCTLLVAIALADYLDPTRLQNPYQYELCTTSF